MEESNVPDKFTKMNQIEKIPEMLAEDDNESFPTAIPTNSKNSYVIKKTKESDLFTLGESDRSVKSKNKKITYGDQKRRRNKIFSPPKKFSFFAFNFPNQHSFSENEKRAKTARASQCAKKRKLKTYEGPTPLHTICRNATSIDEVHAFLKSNAFSPSLVNIKDDNDRLPLHLFSMNKNLSETANFNNHFKDFINFFDEKPTIRSCVLQYLLPSYPTSMVSKDKYGYIPFEYSIVEWIYAANASNPYALESNGHSDSHDVSHSSSSPKGIHEIFLSKGKAAIATAGRTIRRTGPSPIIDDFHATHDDCSGDESEDEDEFMNKEVVMKGLRNDTSALTTENSSDEYFPIGVSSTSQLMFALQMISVIIDDFEKRSREAKIMQSNTMKAISNNSKSSKSPRLFQKSVSSRSFIKKTRGSSRLGQDYNVPPPIASDLDAVFANKSTASNTGHMGNDLTYDNIREKVIETIASIPNFVKMLLLIEDEIQRKLVFNLPIICEVVFNKHSIDQWLVQMLKSKDKRVSEQAVNYLRILSGEAETQYRSLHSNNSHKQGGDPSKEAITNKKNDELYEAVSVLDGLIPSLLGLDERMIEQAATTQIVSRVLDKMVLKPFAVSVVFFDVLFIMVLITSFRFSTTKFLDNDSSGDILKWIYIANACIVYFIIRELGKVISLSMFTRRSFSSFYLGSFWNVVDVLSISIAMTSTILMRLFFVEDNGSLNGDNLRIRICLAVTIGLLWIKVLGLMKTINMQLATFVLAIIQITRDITWFLLILLAQVVSFAQMFHILLVPSTCNTESTSEDEFCKIEEYYLKVYSILLGDFGEFDRDDFLTDFSVSLAVFFTFMVVIVLLNVLIAIVSDSYEKCLLRSEYLFGRARVMLLAELVSFQHLLRPSKCVGKDEKVTNTWKKESKIFFALATLVIISLILGEVAAFFSGQNTQSFAFNIGSILLILVLLVVIFAVLIRGASGVSSPYTMATKIIQWIMFRFIRTSADSWDVKREEEWKGQVNYLQREMSRLAAETTEHTRKLIQEEIQVSNLRRKELETRIHESEEKILSELRKTQEQVNEVLALKSFSNNN